MTRELIDVVDDPTFREGDRVKVSYSYQDVEHEFEGDVWITGGFAYIGSTAISRVTGEIRSDVTLIEHKRWAIAIPKDVGSVIEARIRLHNYQESKNVRLMRTDRTHSPLVTTGPWAIANGAVEGRRFCTDEEILEVLEVLL